MSELVASGSSRLPTPIAKLAAVSGGVYSAAEGRPAAASRCSQRRSASIDPK
jgi:hypothetical protein